MLLALSLTARAGVVINEIHYDPDDETSPEEFIELFNPGDTPVDLSGWRLNDAVDFTFPPGTEIAGGGFVVVAESPPTLLSVHGAASLGPWEKGLNNDGETVELLDPTGAEVDRVSYRSGFPWPTGARGGGGSMELVHPALDNDLGGSWRTSGSPPVPPEAVVYVPAASPGWRYREGTSEASDPVDAWRQAAFTEDLSWIPGTTPVGYGDGDDNTVLWGMEDHYSTVYLRHPFTVPVDAIPSSLRLRVYVDDGAVVWINGTEVARLHAGAGEIPHDGFGFNHEAEWEEITLSNPGTFLIGGTNVLAIHALNGTLGSSDFSIDAELRTPEPGASAAVPTPGAVNSSFSVAVPPQIRQVRHSPESPDPGSPVVITAKVTDPDGVGAVELRYQPVDPGSYIRRTDAAYETDWTPLAMSDDGTGGDAVAGDDVYSATLPGTLQLHRRLVRYRIAATDTGGHALSVPYPDDGQPNFAYFVHGDYPSWSGAFAPGGAPRTFGRELMDDLPVYQLVAREADVVNSQYNGSYDGVHLLGTLVYDGVVYDHVEFENRGEGSTYVSGKNKWRFHFNRARRFQARDDWGREYPSTWTKLNLNACSSPWAAVNRGMAGLDEAISFRLYDLAGVPSPRTHYLSLRVVDSAVETNPSDQYGSDLWGLYMAVEQPGGSFLDDRGLADGNVYKIEQNNGDKKEQGDTQVTDSSDWNDFHSFSNSAQTEQWWRDHMDMPVYYSMRAVNRFSGNVDIRLGFNHYFYHEPTSDRWLVMPWDLDMMFIAETHQAGVIRQQNSILNHAGLALEFRNRCREISDLMGSDAAPDGGQIGQLVDEYAQIVNPTGQARTWADLDAHLWNHHPRTKGDAGNHSGQTNHKGNFFYSPFTDSRFGGTYVRTLISQDHDGFVRHITDYLTDTFPGGNWSPGNGVPAGYGYEYLNYEASDSRIPDTPVLTYVGDPEFPSNALTFQSGGFSDPDGKLTFGRMRWRIAEIAAPGVGVHEAGTPRIYEIETVHEAVTESFSAGFTFPPGVALPGHTYRVRLQHEDNTGRTSHWSQPVQFVAGGTDAPTFAANLVVSELMYHPADPSGGELLVSADDGDFEFLELANVSDSLTLDLSGLSFTEGIAFDFATAAISSLGPGERLVVVSHAAAFAARHGSGLPVAGQYEGALSNGGERLTLSLGGSTAVIDFEYDDAPPWPTEPDGSGVSLVLADPWSVPDPNLASSWVAGTRTHGTPGGAEPDSFGDWLAAQGATDPEAEALPGMSWLMMYALGADLLADPRSALPVAGIEDDPDGGHLRLTFRRRIDASQVSTTVETSTTLAGDWQSGSGIAEVVGSPVDNGDGTETLTVRILATVAGEPVRFVRLNATLE